MFHWSGILQHGDSQPKDFSIDEKIGFRLRQQKRSWGKNDPPPKRVKPCSVTVVLWLLNQAYNYLIPMGSDMSMVDIMCIAIFFLLRPSEYTGTTNDDAAFTLDNVYL